MSIESNVKDLKESEYANTIVMVQQGSFYHVYSKDAYIMSYLFDYQLKRTTTGNTCGFPVSIQDTILRRLEKECTNYVIMNNVFEVKIKKDYECSNKNNYNELFKEAYKYAGKKNKIDEINRFLLENINDITIFDTLNNIEKIIYKL